MYNVNKKLGYCRESATRHDRCQGGVLVRVWIRPGLLPLIESGLRNYAGDLVSTITQLTRNSHNLLSVQLSLQLQIGTDCKICGTYTVPRSIRHIPCNLQMKNIVIVIFDWKSYGNVQTVIFLSPCVIKYCSKP